MPRAPLCVCLSQFLLFCTLLINHPLLCYDRKHVLSLVGGSAWSLLLSLPKTQVTCEWSESDTYLVRYVKQNGHTRSKQCVCERRTLVGDTNPRRTSILTIINKDELLMSLFILLHKRLRLSSTRKNANVFLPQSMKIVVICHKNYQFSSGFHHPPLTRKMRKWCVPLLT